MVEILHTHDAAQAEMVRAALEREGIRVHSVDDNYDPFMGHHVLAVHERDAERAIAIRRRIERGPGNKSGNRYPVPTFLIVVLVLVVVFFVYAVLMSG